MAKRKQAGLAQESLLNWKIYLVVFLAFFSYLPSLNNDFVNWDDIGYIMNNDMITPFSWLNIKKMFSTFFMGNYHPFTMISFAFDYILFGLNPHGYHVHNLLLHILNTFLVYCFIFYLDGKKANLALITALLFAVHPMHVESVAWVSERKDLLYAMYFLLALIFYVKYLEGKRWYLYFFTLALFVISMLSKAQAVTLPLVLILIDIYSKRTINRQMVLEKLPLFTLSLVFGVIAIYAQKAADYINPLNLPAWYSFFYAPYSIIVYLFKFLIPVNLTSVYEYPVDANGALPVAIYFAPLVFLVIFYLLWKTYRSPRVVFFGILFFLVTIFPVLQYLPVGKAVVAERYSYIPYVGLGFMGAFLFLYLKNFIAVKYKNIVYFGGVLFCLWLSVLTWIRSEVWKDSISLWTDVIAKNPKSVNAYMNRAFIYDKNREYDKVIAECNLCLGFDSSNSEVYKNRGIAYSRTGDYRSALADYSKAIRLDTNDMDLYLFRGIIYTDKLKEFDSGIIDFNKYLLKSPGSEKATFNLVVAYFNKQDFASARVYCEKVLEINPENLQAKNLLQSINDLNHEKKSE